MTTIADPETDIVIVAHERDEAYELMNHYQHEAHDLETSLHNVKQSNERAWAVARGFNKIDTLLKNPLPSCPEMLRQIQVIVTETKEAHDKILERHKRD